MLLPITDSYYSNKRKKKHTYVKKEKRNKIKQKEINKYNYLYVLFLWICEIGDFR